MSDQEVYIYAKLLQILNILIMSIFCTNGQSQSSVSSSKSFIDRAIKNFASKLYFSRTDVKSPIVVGQSDLGLASVKEPITINIQNKESIERYTCPGIRLGNRVPFQYRNTPQTPQTTSVSVSSYKSSDANFVDIMKRGLLITKQALQSVNMNNFIIIH